jgi:hypothetical protein
LSSLRSGITGVCKRRKPKSETEGNPMSMFHDEIEDL